MKAFNRVLVVAIAAACVGGSHVTAQSKNPIQAAKDAFKKAREEQQAKKPPQPTAAPSSPAPSSPAPSSPASSSPTAAGLATADCCSPEAISRLAAAVGFVDIVGVKLGMTLEQAIAALKASNPKLVIDIHDGEMAVAGKQIRRPRVILAHLPAASRNPALWANLDGSSESIGVQLTLPPGPMVVETVIRYVSFPNGAPVAASNLVEAHRKKYGPESHEDAVAGLGWIYDLTGKLLRNPVQQQISCMARPHIISGDIRTGDGINEPGKVVPGQESLTGVDEYRAKCVAYVVVRAEVQHGSPTQLEGAFWTMMHSPGLQHNSVALTAAFIKQANENLIKQQEDAGAKRAAPKL